MTYLEKGTNGISTRLQPLINPTGIPSFAQPNVTFVQHDDDTGPMCPVIDRNALSPLLLIPASQWTDTIRPAAISVALALADARLGQQEERVASRTTDVG